MSEQQILKLKNALKTAPTADELYMAIRTAISELYVASHVDSEPVETLYNRSQSLNARLLQYIGLYSEKDKPIRDYGVGGSDD